MKIALAALIAVIAAALASAGAGANGSAYSPGLMYGWNGVGSKADGVRYVAFGMPKSTIVAAVRARDGHVLQSKVLRGFYGVPLVSYDGTAGGLSGDGRTLVLTSYGPLPGEAGKTNIVVLSTRTLGVRRHLVLNGSWSYDALSPDASTLYLVEHISAGQNPRYRVRALSLPEGRLLARPVVDTKVNAALMRGQPATRATSAGGRWAYTLYARQKAVPFIHALDTERKQAYCIDLPVRLDQGRQMGLRLKLEGRKLVVRDIRSPVAVLDTRSFVVKQL
jgi:hypothetical protein